MTRAKKPRWSWDTLPLSPSPTPRDAAPLLFGLSQLRPHTTNHNAPHKITILDRAALLYPRPPCPRLGDHTDANKLSLALKSLTWV